MPNIQDDRLLLFWGTFFCSTPCYVQLVLHGLRGRSVLGKKMCKRMFPSSGGQLGISPAQSCDMGRSGGAEAGRRKKSRWNGVDRFILSIEQLFRQF
jgi:hypothetical protein